MKQDNHIGHDHGGVTKTTGTNETQHKPKTENPIAEKDEVKQAENRQRNQKPIALKRKLRIL
ncbi:hypothetical protein ACSBL2_14960 [Pedobacter sp. AW31-3R]|uniref:hypothetical protein n=1 Tax=Pedobacter sp. AW31-3R TaxID=3445781 RepID=UPI003FA17372